MKPIKPRPLARRWRNDGGDMLTGAQTYSDNGSIRGPGGSVAWRVRPWRYTASAWTQRKRMKDRDFKTQDAAQRHVEKWLAKHGDTP